ncbi:CotH kinase family protein [Adhaeretor mobilis]|uniref:Inner spore coat protein H n=1 Tax=Adhaeretor mobilis TaxID=1930276 RepID=A0A517MSQ6_9BACT|nr:CotH kinase family protein [Adhaeretor mobilis]QDS97872.1 Inner spore coat protein H [Adhaeretor mobilis]
MTQYFSAKIRQIISQAFGNSGPKRGSKFAGRQLRIESLEDRQMLDAASWTASDVGDEASAFFDDSYVHDLYLTFDNEDWFDVLEASHANDADDPYFAADFSADGVVIENVGVRFKGNSSFEGSDLKKSLKIDFDEFDEDNDELTFFGLKKLNLNNNFNDPTQLREKLFYDYASNFVEGVSRAVHTNVYINGELWGLYTAVEQIDKTFVQSRFGSDEDGNLYKGAASDDANDPQADFGSDLTYLGTEPEPYYDYYQLKTNETANDYTELVEFIDVLNNTPAADLEGLIEPLLDVDDALAGMAINNLFANLDSYFGSAHNYYLYDRDDTGQFTHVLWDVNESFGTFAQFTDRFQDMTELEPFWTPVAMGPPGQTEPKERPLMENLWEVEEYSEDYLRDLAEMLREGFDVTSASTRINELANLIRADVYADPYSQYTSTQFETNLDSNISDGMRTIYGLTSFIADRSNYLSAELDSYASTSDLVLNELMSVNVATAQDESGDFDPWVEIYNFGPGLLDLSNLYVTDDAGDLTKWALPSGDLDDGEFLTLWVDGETGEGSSHASFSLSTAGGTLLLTDGSSVIDSTTYDAMAEDTSWARVPDGGGDFETTDQPTFGSENLASVVTIDPVVLYINEFMADNEATIEDPDDAGSYDDWLELYNPGTEPVDLGGMYLTDDLTDSTQWQFADGTTIAAGGYLLIWADDDTNEGETHTSFKLSAGGEAIGLYHIDGTTLIDSIEFGAQTTDTSYGRSPDGSESWVFMSIPTPGEANTAAGDFDSDGDVDGADRVIWEGGFGTSAGAQLDEGDSDSDGDVDGNDFLNWQRNYSGAASAGALAIGTVQPDVTEIGLSAVSSMSDPALSSSSIAAPAALDSITAESTGQDTPSLPSNRHSANFNSLAFAGSMLHRPALEASDNTTTGGYLARQQESTFQHQPDQRIISVDILMSRLDFTIPRVDRSRWSDAATDNTEATISVEVNDLARSDRRSVGKGQSANPHDVVLDELWGTA